MNNPLFVKLLIIFLVAQTLGLLVADKLIQEKVTVTIVTDNPDDVENSAGLFLYILFGTAMLLILIKFVKGRFLFWALKAVESLAIFGTSLIVFAVFWDSILVVFLAIILVIARNVFYKNLHLRNISSTLATAGAGALIGVSLGVIPIIVFLIALSVYDYIAVFKTKHMVTIAKSVTKKNLSFTYALPTKEHQFELGTGDLVMPLAFASSVLAATKGIHAFPYYFIPSILILLASLAGLVLTLGYLSKRIGKALPALPPQAVLMLIAFAVTKLLGF